MMLSVLLEQFSERFIIKTDGADHSVKNLICAIGFEIQKRVLFYFDVSILSLILK